jgi:hypothetical protein
MASGFMSVTVCHLKHSNVSMTLSKYMPIVQLPDFFIPKILRLSTLLHHNSLLFLNETKTILPDGISYRLFDLGLGITNF